jgi:putative ABC transport system permease protein
LLQPFPYEEPDRLIRIWTELTARGVDYFPESPANLDDIQRESQVLSGVAGLVTRPGVLHLQREQPITVSVATVTWNTLDVLGREVQAGRSFTELDGAYSSSDVPVKAEHPATAYSIPRVALISNRLWATQFGSSQDVLGRSVDLNGELLEIVGVLPDDLELLFSAKSGLDRSPEVWVPLRPDIASAPRVSVFLHLIARLEEGATLDQAQADLDQITDRLNTQFPAMGSAGARRIVASFSDDYESTTRPLVVALFAAAFCLLGVAILNVSGVLLLRANSRQREFSIRAVLGATRWKLLLTLFADVVWILVPAVLLGMLFAALGVKLVAMYIPADLARGASISVSWSVLLYCLLTAFAAAAIASLYAAWKVASIKVSSLRERTSGSAGESVLFRNAIVTLQIGVSFVLIVACGFTLRSVLEVSDAELGFEHENVLTFQIGLSSSRYDTAEKRWAATDEIEATLAHIPGVASVGAIYPLPLSGSEFNGPFVASRPLGDGTDHNQANYKIILPGFFEVTGATLMSGRFLRNSDNVIGSSAVIVNEQLATAFWPVDDAIGKTIWARFSSPDMVPYEVVGVVADQVHTRPNEDPVAAIYVTLRASGITPPLSWTLGADGQSMDGVAQDVRNSLAGVVPLDPVSDMVSMTSYVDASTSRLKFSLAVLGIVGSVAWLVSIIGLYSAIRSSVDRRRSEIALRMAIGATPGRVIRGVLLQALSLAVLALILGSVFGLFGAQTLLSDLRVTIDFGAITVGMVVAVSFLAASVVATFLPAVSASKVDPAQVLRIE